MIVENIKRLASEKNLSVSDVEEICGLGKRTVYRWDTNSPSVEKVKVVADYFGTSIDSLIRGSDNEK